MGENPNFDRARRLLYTATQLMALAHDLESDAVAPKDRAPARLEPNDSVLVELARQIYRARRERTLLREWADLFGEPAWDIVIDLYIAAHENRDVSVSSACIGAAVPSTTALRWLRVLEDRGIAVRDEDPVDHRRTFVRLSAAAFAELNRYFRHIADGHAAFVMLSPERKGAEADNVETI